MLRNDSKLEDSSRISELRDRREELNDSPLTVKVEVKLKEEPNFDLPNKTILRAITAERQRIVKRVQDDSSFRFMKGVLSIKKASVHSKTQRVFCGGGYRVPKK